MTRPFTFGTCALLGLLAVDSAALAEGGDSHSIAAKAGALGLGVEYTYSLNDQIGFRVGLNGSKLGFDAEESGIAYDFDLVWDCLSVAVDFHPRRGPLRVTGGLLSNDNRIEAISRPAGNVTVGGTTYTPDEIGSLYGLVEFDSTAPFVGVGWDWSRKRERFGVSFDVGLVKQGAPRVILAASGPIVSDPMFAPDIEAEQGELTASLDGFDLLPYATLGLVFRF